MNAPMDFDPTDARACKRLIAEALGAMGLTHRLSARTIGFADLGGGSMVFVSVHDWHPDPRFENLVTLARAHGFRVQAR